MFGDRRAAHLRTTSLAGLGRVSFEAAARKRAPLFFVQRRRLGSCLACRHVPWRGQSRRRHAARSICSRFCINLGNSRIESHCIVRGIRGSPCRARRLRQLQAVNQGRQRVRLSHGPHADLDRKQGRHLAPTAAGGESPAVHGVGKYTADFFHR